MTKTTKQMLSILLVCAVLLTLLPAVTFATDEVEMATPPSIIERVRAVIESVTVAPTGVAAQGIDIELHGEMIDAGMWGWWNTSWRLYDNGILAVGSGHLESTGFGVFAGDSRVRKIIFEGTNTLGSDLDFLFHVVDHTTMIIGAENWDTSAVTSMTSMFWGTSALMSLDLSGWDTRNVTDMDQMFGHSGVRQLTLGVNFVFAGGTAAALRPVPNDATFTGYWQNVGTGTIDNPLGDYVFTSAEFMQNFNGAIHADTWVWQPHDHARPAPRIIQLNRSGTDTPFDPVLAGYPNAFLFSTHVQNISNAPTGGLTVTISGPNASSFEITHLSRAAAIGVYYLLLNGSDITADLPSLPVGNTTYLPSSRRFLIQPMAGLTAGTYTARVTVSVDNHPSGEFDEYFDVEFIVE